MLSVTFHGAVSAHTLERAVQHSHGVTSTTWRGESPELGPVVLKLSDHTAPERGLLFNGVSWSQETSNPIWGESGARPLSCMVELSHVDAALLLYDEARRVLATEGAWNHTVIEYGRAHVRGPSIDSIYNAVLMPAHAGLPLSRLSRDTQRDLFPRMLPALWRALLEHAHHALTPEHLIVSPDGAHFAITSPGTSANLSEPADDDEFAYYWETETLFRTSDARHYPLLAPHSDLRMREGLDRADLCAYQMSLFALDAAAAAGVREVAELPMCASLGGHYPSDYSWISFVRGFWRGDITSWSRALEEQAPAELLPPAADMLAVAIMYYRILTGREPFELDAPAWLGRIDEARMRRVMEVSYSAPVDPRHVAADVTTAEARLARALLDLDADRIREEFERVTGAPWPDITPRDQPPRTSTR